MFRMGVVLDDIDIYKWLGASIRYSMVKRPGEQVARPNIGGLNRGMKCDALEL